MLNPQVESGAFGWRVHDRDRDHLCDILATFGKLMKSLPIVCFLLMLVSQSAHAQSVADQNAVRQVPNAFVTAWATHDGHQLAKLVADDVDFVNVGGTALHGRADFELYHTRLLAGLFKASTLAVLDEKIRFIRPDVAVLLWTWRITGDGQVNPATHAPRRGIFSMIVEEQGGRWLITAGQNTNEYSGEPNPFMEGITPSLGFPPIK